MSLDTLVVRIRANGTTPATPLEVLAVPVADAHPGYRRWVLDATPHPGPA
ncbi:hypothetical protein K7711_38800 [Nocardia sp. CA2R105]|nr:hypothetical protein [Nocardia coffeae]MBY8862473.1 hypothetical protein [Nocardia coffeae]